MGVCSPPRHGLGPFPWRRRDMGHALPLLHGAAWPAGGSNCVDWRAWLSCYRQNCTRTWGGGWGQPEFPGWVFGSHCHLAPYFGSLDCEGIYPHWLFFILWPQFREVPHIILPRGAVRPRMSIKIWRQNKWGAVPLYKVLGTILHFLGLGRILGVAPGHHACAWKVTGAVSP